MKKILAFILLGAMILNGCASYSVYQASKQQVYAKKVIQAKQNAVKAFANEETGTVGIGIDVLAWEVLTENPGKQLGAAVVDGVMLWAAYEGIQYLQDYSNNNTVYNVTITGDYNNVVIVDGSSYVTTDSDQRRDQITK